MYYFSEIFFFLNSDLMKNEEYLNIFVQSYSPPIPVSMIATSTLSSTNILNAITVKNIK